MWSGVEYNLLENKAETILRQRCVLCIAKTIKYIPGSTSLSVYSHSDKWDGILQLCKVIMVVTFHLWSL